MKRANQNEQIQEIENNDLIKVENTQHFIIIYESVYKNTKLTADEIALIVKLSAAAPNFKPTKEKLMQLLHISENRLLKASKGLQEKGYLQILNKGQSGSVWILNQQPQFLETYKNETKENILNAFVSGELTLPQLYELAKKNVISRKDLKEIVNKITEILKTNAYK